MNVFSKRNALVGFLTLQALKRRRTKQLRRRAPRIALFSLVGLASLAAVIGIVAVLLRRRGEDDPAGLGEENEIVGEYVSVSSEADPGDLTAE